jgi:pimeloyl-ACP methyl ester carboxylesterase
LDGVWSVVEIAGKPADVYEPAGGPRFGVLYLHPLGLEMLRDNPVFTSLFAELRLGCIAPHGGRSWWADRICPEFDPKITPERHLLEHVLPYFPARWGISPPGIGLLGISMGGQAALRLAFKYPQRFSVVAGISSALDHHEWYGRGLALDEMYDSKEQCRQDTALLHVHPSHHPAHLFFCIDPDDRDWYRGNDRLHEKLAALGIEHECDLITRAGGHSWQYFNSMADRAVRFINAGLEQQARRLL